MCPLCTVQLASFENSVQSARTPPCIFHIRRVPPTLWHTLHCILQCYYHCYCAITNIVLSRLYADIAYGTLDTIDLSRILNVTAQRIYIYIYTCYKRRKREKKLILERDYFYPRLVRKVKGGRGKLSSWSQISFRVWNRVGGCNLRFQLRLLNIWKMKMVVAFSLSLFSIEATLSNDRLVKPLTFVWAKLRRNFFPLFFRLFMPSFYIQTFLLSVHETWFEKYIYTYQKKKSMRSIVSDAIRSRTTCAPQ